MLTGAARNPPSFPICQASTPGIWPKSRIRKRESQPVAALLNGEEWPRVAVDHDHVAEELGVPNRGKLPLGDEVTDDSVEELTRVGVEERSVLVERAILDRDRDFPVCLVGRELVVLPGRGTGK